MTSNSNQPTEDPPPRVRRLPFQDNIHTSIFTPREYQIELLDAARKRNLVMCLGTNPSKMFVTLMLIRELAHQLRHTSKPDKKWTVVIFSTVQLVSQYAELIRDHTDLTVIECQEKLDDDCSEQYGAAHVLVMTMSLFLEETDRKRLDLSSINLLVLGDSQTAAEKDSPLRLIVEAVRNCPRRPRMLGLSANIMKSHCEEPHRLEIYMNCLERTVSCAAETASEIVSLSRFGNRSSELVVECRTSCVYVSSSVQTDDKQKSVDTDAPTPLAVLEAEIKRVVEPALDFVIDHIYSPEDIYGIIDEDLNIPDPKIVPRFYLSEILYLLETLGPWCADRAARRFLKELKKHKDDTPYERHYLLISMVFTVMEMIRALCDYHFHALTEPERILKYSSSKVLRLLDVLCHFKPPDPPQNSSQKSPVVSNIKEINITEEKETDVIESKTCITSPLNSSVKISTQTDSKQFTTLQTDSLSVPSECGDDNVKCLKGPINCLTKVQFSANVNHLENGIHCNGVTSSVLNDNIKNERLCAAPSILSYSSRYTTGREKPFSHFGSRREPNSSGGYRKDFGRSRLSTFNIDDPNSLCGLVFVERRNTACIMHLLLKELSRHHDKYRFLVPNFLVGQKKSPYQQQQQSDDREKTVEHRKQEEVLRRFRLRECNLLVATSVLQDGVDIPKCNLVVRFDLPKDYRAYVQCKGRARASNSYFIILVEHILTNSFMDDLAKFKTVEEILLNRCHEREIPTDEEIDGAKADKVMQPYFPRSDGTAKVTMSSAIALINRYCAKLPSDTFTRLTPRCKLKERCGYNDAPHFQAVLYLPINSPIKEPVIGPLMQSKSLAKMAAALKMCEVLHVTGEIDDNLLPVGKESVQYEEELMENWDDETVPEGAPKPGTTKRRQYYYKQTAEAFTSCQPKPNHPTYLYVINMKLTCPIPEEQNTRGRRIYAPEETPRCFGILTYKPIPKICGFPVFTRSGEVTVKLDQVCSDLCLEEDQLLHLSYFHNFTFSKVLRLEKYPMTYDPANSESSYFVVPLNTDAASQTLCIDWDFVNLIYTQLHFKPRLLADEERAAFKFDLTKYQDSVVMPWYRNLDQPQYFYVAEICYKLNPQSDFPDDEFETFEKYYFKKYNIQIQNLGQPLLDVDHTSARLNLLTPRYVNRKGVALPTSSEETKRAKRENLQQKQILVPELCTIHPFPASFWRKAVCLPCILYRINCLLIAERLRVRVAKEMGLGMPTVNEDFMWPVLDFGWSLADVLKAHAANKEAAAAITSNDKAITDGGDTSLTRPSTLKKNQESVKKDKSNWENTQSEGGFVIDTWSNDMIPSQQMNTDYSDDERNAYEDRKVLGSLMMLNDGGIFGDDPELAELNMDPNLSSWQPGDKQSGDNGPIIRYGSPSNFEDMGWDFDSGEEVGVMNIPGFSFICGPGAGLNLEDLSRDIEAYEEDGLYQEMQTETFDDDDEKAEYPTISYWGGNNEENGLDKSVPTINSQVQEDFLEDEEVSLDWAEVDLDDATKAERERHTQEYFQDVMKSKKKIVNFLSADDPLELGKPFTSCSKVIKCVEKDATIIRPSFLENVKDDLLCIDNGVFLPGSPNVDDLEDSILKNKFKRVFNVAHTKEDSNGNCNKYSVSNSFKAEICDTASRSVTAAPFIKSVITESALASDTCNNVNLPVNMAVAFSFDEQTSLISHPGPSPSVILQALTMSNANDGINLERLETIGDSFLKHAITTYLYCTYPNIHEGKLSYLRSKQVSNLNLYRLGRKKNLGECMVATKFEPNDNWLPPGYFVPKELEQALIDSGIPAGHWNIANLPALDDWKELDADIIRKALVKTAEEELGEDCELESKEVMCLVASGDDVLPSKTFRPTENHTPGDEVCKISPDDEIEDEDANPEALTCFIPYNLMTQHSIPDKSIADCVEALIGAYLTCCGPRGALLFMSWLGIKVLPKVTDVSCCNGGKGDAPDIPQYGHLNPPPSPLLRIVPNPEMELNILLDGYDMFEERIGYQFQDKSYLLQAFTHASYHYNRLTDCYQRLEFLGDAVLDYLITRHLYEDPRQHSPGTLTDLRSALVNNTIFATMAVKHDFHKYFKAICPGLFAVIDKFVKMQKENNHQLNEEYYFIEEDECEEAEDIEVPKALGDVFESVAGAIYLDSNMSLDTVWRVYYSMMKTEIEQFMTNVPKSPIRELLEMEPETAKFGIPEKTLDGKVRVTVEIFGKGKFRGLGRNYRIAKCTAAKHALKALKRRQGISTS